MDTLSPSKRPASPIITRSRLRGVLDRLCEKDETHTPAEVLIIADAQRRLNKCEYSIANIAIEALLDAHWKLETEAVVSGTSINVYYRDVREGQVYLKLNGKLTDEDINMVGCRILIESGRTVNYLKSRGIVQRIFTNGWTPDQSCAVRERFKGLIVLEDSCNVKLSEVMRVPRISGTSEKSIGPSFQVTPIKRKRSPSAFVNITPGGQIGKRARLYSK
jgi:hypothetical protein